MKLSYLALCLALACFGAGTAHAELQSPKISTERKQLSKQAENPTLTMKKAQQAEQAEQAEQKESPTVKKKMDGGAEGLKKAQGAETEEMQTPKRLR